MIWVTDDDCAQALYEVRQRVVFQLADESTLSADPAKFSPSGMSTFIDCIEDGSLIAISVDGRLVFIRGHDVVRVTFVPESEEVSE